MADQYFCGTDRRRQAVAAHPVLNGIDYLEVLDLDAPEGSPPQRTLLVRFLKALPGEEDALGAGNLQVEGGVRIANIGVEWAGRAADAESLFTAGLLTEAERDFFLAQPEPDRLLLVRTEAAGDFSTYHLRLVRSPTDPAPPPGFDPQLSAVPFSFKVECPSDFDCPSGPDCPPESFPSPVIDYLARDYASFRQLMLDRLSVTLPGWQERSPADLGIALVETLAYAADHLSYYQDAVATEAYLGTARRRTSVRRHARLLDYPMHEGCNARAWVQILAEAAGIILPAGSPLLTRLAGLPVRLAPDEAPKALEQRPVVFETMHVLALFPAHNKMQFYTWGEEECCLPRGATRATLLDSDQAQERLRLRAGDVLVLSERLSPGTGQAVDADPAHRYAVRLVRVTPEATLDAQGGREPGDPLTDPLNDRPVVEIEWAVKDALPFPLCLSLAGQPGEPAAVALGNIVLADHGRTVEELLPPAPEAGRYRPSLAETGITHSTGFDLESMLGRPAAQAFRQDPRQALPVIHLEEDGVRWEPRRDLLNSDRFAPDFVVEVENDGQARLRFGDGRAFGQRPPPGVDLRAVYRVGNGPAGNVGAEAIAHVVSTVDGIGGVRNPMPAEGGAGPEDLEEVRLYAPQAFRTQERAVTEADYAAAAERHPEVQRAAATRRWTGSWHTIFITVDRKGGRPVDADFERELVAFLDGFRLAGQDVEIDAPRFVPLDIAMTVCVADGYYRGEVKRALLAAFSRGDLPGGRRGFFHPDNFTFGQPVYLSRVVSTALEVPGVSWVDLQPGPGKPNRFQRFGARPRGEFEQGSIRMGRLEIARLDNDPSAAENGRIEFFMEGGV